MNSSEYAQYQKVDKELNKVYQKIMNEYKGQDKFLVKLRKSQRLWI